MKYLKGFLILIVGVILGVFIPRYLDLGISFEDEKNDNYYVQKYRRFEDVDNILKNQYYDFDGIDNKSMLEDAIKAYVDGIGDPYTVYMDSEENSGFMESLEGEVNFEGIGAVVSKKDYYILIEEILKESPAYKAGLKPLDRIVKIEDEYVQEESLNDSVNRMRGPKGSTVNLVIERITGEDSEILDFSVIRDTINVPSLTTKILNVDGKNIGYIEISLIGEETENILKKEIPELVESNLDGMILDLRGNGGGLMNIAVDIVSHFVPKGKLVVSSKYQGFTDDIYTSKGFGEFENMKIVVLIDGLTASAGEIIALALQEQANATLLGTQSFGKGTIQTLYDFNDGDSLKYTIGKWFPPSEMSIDKIGITPDIIVEFDYTGYVNDDIDNQLQEAKNLFK